MNSISKEVILQVLKNSSDQLQPTQTAISIPIILRLLKKMKAGILFSPIKIKGNVISDGHHRYIAALLANYNLEIIDAQISTSTLIHSWENIMFDENDWDNLEELKSINQQDALRNNITLEEIEKLLI